MKNKEISKCCKAKTIIEGKTTRYYVCTKCGKSCDIDYPWSISKKDKKQTTKRWKPKDGEKFFVIYLCSEFRIYDSIKVRGHWFDEDTISINNCFKTKKEAKEMIQKIKKLLKSDNSTESAKITQGEK